MNHLNCMIKVSIFPEIIKYINMQVTVTNINRVIIIKNGDHRLSNENNLKKLAEISYNLFKNLET